MAITDHPNNSCRCCAAPTDFAIRRPQLVPPSGFITTRRLDPDSPFTPFWNGDHGARSFSSMDGMAIDSRGHVWNAVDQKAVEFDTFGVLTGREIDLGGGAFINAVYIDANDNIFIGASGLRKFDSDLNQQWSQGVGSYAVKSVAEDSNGDLICTTGGGDNVVKILGNGDFEWQATNITGAAADSRIVRTIGTTAYVTTSRFAASGAVNLFEIDVDGNVGWSTAPFGSDRTTWGLAVLSGNLVVGLGTNTIGGNTVAKVDASDGSNIATFGFTSGSTGTVFSIAADTSGNVYVAGGASGGLEKYNSSNFPAGTFNHTIQDVRVFNDVPYIRGNRIAA